MQTDATGLVEWDAVACYTEPSSSDLPDSVQYDVMRKKPHTKRNSGMSATTIANREYKQKIYAMCRRVLKGDKAAERILNKEIESNALAQWAVKHWMKLHASRQKKVGMGPNKDGLLNSQAKGREQRKGVNAFKPYQGGLPGLGKKA